MRLSNMETLAIALIPTYAENLENKDECKHNLVCEGVIKTVKYARNGLYMSVALMALGLAGESRFQGELIKKVFFSATLISGSIFGASATILFENAMKLRKNLLY